MITKDAVWLVTGCSKGLGRALAEQVLAAGYRVVVTARREADIAEILGVSTSTISKHIASAKERLGAINKTHAVAVAMKLNVF